MNKIVTGKSTQTVIDLSLQLTGNVDNVFDVIDENKIENLDVNLSGVDISFEINNTFVQSYYITNMVTVGTKPYYKNKLQGGLKTKNGNPIVQKNSYKILIK